MLILVRNWSLSQVSGMRTVTDPALPSCGKGQAAQCHAVEGTLQQNRVCSVSTEQQERQSQHGFKTRLHAMEQDFSTHTMVL